MDANLLTTAIPGCYIVELRKAEDARGSFVKTFHQGLFETWGLRTDFAEEYYSVSHEGVIRGMHFQVPPSAHAKVVNCTQGRVLDVTVDLRKGSPTYRQCFSIELDEAVPRLVYLPVGLAHGFLSLSEPSVMCYRVTSVYSKPDDTGILWNTVGFSWPGMRHVVSARDSAFAAMESFDSPFMFE